MTATPSHNNTNNEEQALEGTMFRFLLHQYINTIHWVERKSVTILYKY